MKFIKWISLILLIITGSLMSVAQSVQVESIYPSSDTLPQNTLRLYIYFSEPMEEGVAVQHVHLLNEQGDEMRGIFLDMSYELWDPTGKRLTLLFDPGRVKTGLVANQRFGNPLIAGQSYQIIIDTLWKSQLGRSFNKSFSKTIFIGPADSTQLSIRQWGIKIPNAAKEKALMIHFGKPLDHASAIYSIAIFNEARKPVTGSEYLLANEKGYVIIPKKRWEKGKYIIRISKSLEDISGNNLREAFERNPALRKSGDDIEFIFLSFQIM